MTEGARRTPARLALGFLVAPLAVPLVHALLEVARSRAGPEGYVRYVLLDGLLAAVTWTAPAAYLVALPIGIPLVLALRAAGRLTAAWVVGLSSLAGAGAGVLAALAVARAGGGELVQARVGLAGGVAAGLAALVAAVFCGVAGVRRRAPPAGPGPTPRPSP